MIPATQVRGLWLGVEKGSLGSKHCANGTLQGFSLSSETFLTKQLGGGCAGVTASGLGIG